MNDETQAAQKAKPDDGLNPRPIAIAFEKLFSGGRGVAKYPHSGLRYVKLDRQGTTLIEQNPAKKSEWAKQARAGKRIAWVMRNGHYLARVIEGEVTLLDEDKFAKE